MNNITIVLLIFLAFACSHRTDKSKKTDSAANNIHNTDTITGSKNLINQIAGSAYLLKATGYFIISVNDTSGFMPIFSESKENGKINIDLNLPYSGLKKPLPEKIHINDSKPYSLWFKELEIILQTASKEFNLDSLSSISIGRLILTGDLAVEITKAYKNKFGDNEKITTADYHDIENFLLTSKLATEVNKLLKPYNLKCTKISIEKTFFTTKGDLLNNSVLQTMPEDIPETILDCITWVITKQVEPTD